MELPDGYGKVKWSCSWAVGPLGLEISGKLPLLEPNRALGTTFLGTQFFVGLADILAVWGPVMTRLMQHLKICGFVGKQAGCWWVPELFVGAPFCAHLYLMTAMTCGWMCQVRTEAVKKTKSKVDQDVPWQTW